MALLGMGDVHYNVCSSCGVLEVPWIHSGTLLRTILDYVGYIITGLHRLLHRHLRTVPRVISGHGMLS